MKALNIKLATFSFAALLLASCSDNGADNPVNPITPAINSKLLGISVKSNTDAKELSARVTNYKVTNTKGTRASFSDVFGDFNSMPAESSITPTGNELQGNIYASDQAGTYIVSSDKTISLGNVGNTTIYVKKGATLELNNVYQLQGNVTIYVMSGATLVDATKDMGNQGITIYNYGTLQFTYKNDQGLLEKYIGKYQYIYNYGDANWSNNTINSEGHLYVGGDFKAKAWGRQGGGTLYVSGNFEYPNEDLTFDGNFYIRGKLSAKNITFNNNANLYNECGVFATENINITGNNCELHVAYLNAQKLDQSASSNIYLKNNSYINTPNYFNHNAGVGSITLEGDNAVAYIIGEKLHYNHSDGNKNDLKMFRTSGNQSKIYFKGVFCEEKSDNPVQPTLNNEANVIEVTTENQNDFTIKKDACNPGHNDNGDPTPGPDPTPEPKADLDLITTIEYPNHTHDISATCVKEYNNKMYLSYHTRGAGHGACLEVFSPVTNNQVTMEQYLQDTENMIDFNHLIIDGKTTTPRVLTVGSHFKKGAMTATIDIKNDGLLNTESTEITENQETKTIEPMQMINLVPATAENAKLGYDENCIVRDGDKYVVATTRGYMVYDTDFNEIKMTKTDGRVKHLSLNNSKIASLTFDRQLTETEDENTAIPAHINIYPAGTTDFSVTPEHSFAVEAITPNNGKNTIALVGDRVYACLGGAGFYCYDLDGNEQWHYQIKNALNTQGDKAGLYKAAANGCFIGGKYIYVAYGSAGLKVLDMDGNLVAERYKKIKKGNYSANYVTVYNGYIYVAHGRDRLQVYKLYNCDADTDVSYNE